MKRIKLNNLLFLIAAFCCLSATAHDVLVDGIYYNIDGYNATVTYPNNVNYYSDNSYYSGNVSIPATITYKDVTYPVTSIGYCAFIKCTSLSSVTIPNTVTSIGERAFDGCTGLTNVTIPNSVTSIHYGAFERCSGLTDVTIPNSVTTISACTFFCCYGLVNITIPNSVKSIGQQAFEECRNLTSISIPNSVSTIDYKAFYNCSRLTNINVPNSVDSIGEYAFSGTAWYTNQPNGLIYIGSVAYKYKGTMPSGTSITLRDGTLGITGEAFYNKSGLKSITIPNTVTNIGWAAFRDCTNLTSINIPNSVTSIGHSAFDGTAWYENQPDGMVYAGSVAYCYKGTMPSGTNIVLKEGTVSISRSAFYDRPQLTSVTIPNSVTSIGIQAFMDCSSLTSITIPNSVTSIKDDAFSGCSGISYVTIPNSVTSIAAGAFSGCSGLISVTIPNSVTSIGAGAFQGCSGLTSVTIPSSVTEIGYNAFKGCTSLVTLNFNAVSCSNFYSKGEYELSPFENLNISTINIGNSVKMIPAYFAYGLTNLTNLTIGNAVTHIGNKSFYGCTGLTHVTIPSLVTSIGRHAFYNCNEMTNLTIGNSVDLIGDYAFTGCNGLTSIAVSSGNSKYDSRNNCNAIIETASNTMVVGCKNTTIPNSVTAIGEEAFYYCTYLTNVIIPNSVTSIGAGAFQGCSGLTGVTCLATTPPNISYNSFSNYSSATLTVPRNCKGIYQGAENWKRFSTIIEIPFDLEISGIYYAITGSNTVMVTHKDTNYNSYSGSVTIPSSVTYNSMTFQVTSIGNYAFRNCSELSSITIPNSVIDIGEYAFYNCSRLTGVIIPNSVTSIGSMTFYGCSGLTSVTIGNSVTSIGYYAFQGCTSLTTLNYNAVSCADFSSTASARPFYNLNISSINLGNNVHRIPAYFAYGLTGLTSITIPNSINSIGNYAFQGCTSLETLIFNAESCADFSSSTSHPFYSLNISNIYFGNNVQKIPAYFAYGLSKLTSIFIPNTVTSIGGYAFYGCSSLNSLTIGNSVTSIGSNAFRGCSGLSNLNIPNSVTSIGNYAFYDCSGLSGLTIPNSVTSIGNYAFSGCSGLSSVSIPNSVTSIGNYAFQNCSGLSQVSISDITAWCGINFGSSSANPLCYAQHLYLNNAEVTDLVLPTTVNYIRNYAFYGCSGLTNLTIPNSVTSIGSYAFYGCSGLTNLTIPNSVASIGNNAFQGCSALQTLYFNAASCNNFNSNSSYHPFYNLNISKINIGDSVVKIPAYFAYGLPKLTNVTIGNSVTFIGDNAFTGCTGLTRVDISDLSKWCRINFGSASTNPLYYAQHLYLNNDEVTDLVIPDDVEAIGNYAFYNCSLTSVRFHQSLASVGKQAFNNIPTIETVTCAATTPPSWNDLAMFTTNVYNHTPLYVPIGSERAYMTDQCWGQFATIVGKDIQNEILARSILLNQSQVSLQVGGTSQLIATVLPDSTTNKSVTWLSNAPSVASVDENGLVTALAVGNATITAMTTDGSNLSAYCGVTVTEDLSEYDSYLSLNDVAAFRGDTIVIPVAMTNTESIISFQTDIFLPEGLELLQEDGEYIIDPSSRMTRTHSIMSNDVASGAVRVICYSSNYKPFTGNSGDDLFYITVKVADNAEGDYIIQLKNTLLTNTEFVDLAAPDVAATVNVKAYLLGDANNSGTVTVTDVVVTAQYVLEMNPQPFVFEAADVNFDNIITVADVSRIVWMVLNPTLNAPRRAPALWNNGDRMSGEGITLAAGETRTVSIMLDNEMDYSAFQLDLKVPEGLMVWNFRLTDRAGSHAFDVNTLADGKTRALCYSPMLTAIRGNEGTVLTFDVTATTAITGDITVDNIELVTTDCQTVHLDAFAIGVNNATSVNEITGGKTVARVEYYNLAGQQIDRPESGVTLVVTTYTDGTRTTTKVIK